MQLSHLKVCSTHKTLTRRSKNHRHLLTQLSNCWRKDYLLNLRAFRGAQLKGQRPVINVGDVVILKDDNAKRVFWRLGRIVELLKGSDGRARAALVNVANENGPPKVLKRSIVHLVPIEVADPEVADPEAEESTTATDLLESSPTVLDATETEIEQVDAAASTDSTRPRRQAAVLGEAVRRTWTGH